MEFSSLGGWVATRASGMKKNIYGNIEDLVSCTSIHYIRIMLRSVGPKNHCWTIAYSKLVYACPSISIELSLRFDSMSNEYLSSWGHSTVVITVEWTSLYARHSLRHQTTWLLYSNISWCLRGCSEFEDCTHWKPYQLPNIRLLYHLTMPL